MVMSTLTGQSNQSVATADGLDGLVANSRVEPTLTATATVDRQTETHVSSYVVSTQNLIPLWNSKIRCLCCRCQQVNDRGKENPDVVCDYTAADAYSGGK
jgi:hypothetical protein